MFRGGYQYAHREAMDGSNANGVDDLSGLAGHGVPDALTAELPDDLMVRRAEVGAERMRAFACLA